MRRKGERGGLFVVTCPFSTIHFSILEKRNMVVKCVCFCLASLWSQLRVVRALPNDRSWGIMHLWWMILCTIIKQNKAHVLYVELSLLNKE